MMSIVPSFQTNQKFLQKQSHQILDCFNMVYNVLYAILRHRREEMIQLIPSFFVCISSLFECFTSPDILTHSTGRYNKNFSGKISMRPLASCCPIPVSFSKLISRLFLQMTVKSNPTSDPKFNSIKPFAKYVPFLLTQLLALPTSTRWNISTDEWKSWCFVCLDLCDDHGRDMVLSSLNQGSLIGLRVIYKNLVGDWENNHRHK